MSIICCLARGVRHGWLIVSMMGQEDLSVDLRGLEGPHHRGVVGEGGGAGDTNYPRRSVFREIKRNKEI